MLGVLALAVIMAVSSVTQALARHQAQGAQTFVICTGYGLVSVTVDAGGNPVDYMLPCPECVVPALATLASPTSEAPSHSPIRFVPDKGQSLWQDMAAGLWHDSRAPPVLV